MDVLHGERKDPRTEETFKFGKETLPQCLLHACQGVKVFDTYNLAWLGEWTLRTDMGRR